MGSRAPAARSDPAIAAANIPRAHPGDARRRHSVAGSGARARRRTPRRDVPSSSGGAGEPHGESTRSGFNGAVSSGERNANGKMLFQALSIKLAHIIKEKVVLEM